MPSIRPLRPRDPRSVGPYELVGRIGEGGMGAVYLARTADDRNVAVKIVRPELTDDAAFIARFHREVSNARRVASFSTAQVLDHGEEAGRAYLVTEYIEGPSLGQYIAEHGALSPGLLHGVAVGVAAALVAIHGAGLIHRDLKPGNVLLSLSGPRVIDFGIARALDGMGGGLTVTGQLVGSPGWIAPEQLAGAEVTTAVDIFTWGCLVAYAGNGSHPYGTGDFALLALRVAQAEPDLGSLPAPLDRLVAAALARDPRDRPTAQELLLALVGATPGGEVRAPAEVAEAAEVRETAETREAAETAGSGADRGTGSGHAPPTGPAAGSAADVTMGDAAARETIADTWRAEELAPPARADAGPRPAAGPAPDPAPTVAEGRERTEPGAIPPTVAVGSPGGPNEPTLPAGRAGHPVSGHRRTGRAPRRRRPALVAGGIAAALCLVAAPLAYLALKEGGNRPAAKGPAPLPKDPLLVRVDRGPGWPRTCVANIGIVTPGDPRPKVLLPDDQCDMLPHWSPDHSKIAFTKVTGGRSELWTVNADGTGPKPVTTDVAGKTRPAWSPDGRRLAFMRDVGGNAEIFVITLADGTVRRLTNSPAKEDDPAWSRDGERIAFWSDKSGSHQIYTLSVDDPAAPWTQVTPGGIEAGDPVWSPDGRQIAYTGKNPDGDGDIWVTASDGGGTPRRVTSGPQNDMDPGYSRNGKWIAFVRGPVETPCVWAVRTDGTGARNITPLDSLIGHPDWN